MNFYNNLVGTENNNLIGIDINAMRDETQLNHMQRKLLVEPIGELETLTALKGIGDLKAPGLDGYGATFFKANWNIIKVDLLAVAKEFFEDEKMYLAVNNTLVTLILKNSEAKTIKDFRPISCFTTLYKITSSNICSWATHSEPHSFSL